MEVINLNDLEPVSIKFDDSTTGFGGGIELLMNDKKRASSGATNIDLGELDNLENELNELSNKSFVSGGSGGAASSSNTTGTKTLSGLNGFASGLFGYDTPSGGGEPEKNDSNLGQATKDSMGNTKTWDGFSKFNEFPDTNTSSSGMNEREKRRKKRIMIKKLEEWYEKGLIKNNSHFNLDSNYEEVEDEYETALEDKRKKDSIKLQGWWFMTFVNSVEYANAAFNPFDLNLDGWGEQVSEDIDSYEEIFSELHEKYKGGKLSPELSLLLRLGFSAAMVNFTNKALSTATPAFNDVIRQNPELMKMFSQATVNSMSQQSPGFAFANNLVNPSEQINTSFGPPPRPIETKSQPAPSRPSMTFTQAPNSRSDINVARGAMFREEGVDVTRNFTDMNKQEKSVRPPAPPAQSQNLEKPVLRREMNGPRNTDVDNILSGLKPKNVQVSPQQMQPQSHEQFTLPSQNINIQEDDSMISISSLKDLNSTKMPKKGRRNRSDKNTVSLDI
jgi:hypothetical protein